MSKSQNSKNEKKAFLKATGERITLHRSLRVFTTEGLAIKSNLEYQQLFEIEAGLIDIKILTLEKIASCLDVDVIELMFKLEYCPDKNCNENNYYQEYYKISFWLIPIPNLFYMGIYIISYNIGFIHFH